MPIRAMVFVTLVLCGIAWPKDRYSSAPTPDQFTIGRLTFFDFGPPFDYYEVLVARPIANGTSIERILLTPPGDACFQSAKVEMVSAKLNESIEELFRKTNPCAIPEKELHRELKRCRKCLSFSGVRVNMQVQCGLQTRMIGSEILDKDMFDPAANTPTHTSWTMQLLDGLDKALGPDAMDKPIFPSSESEEAPATGPHSESLKDLAAGKYDSLFPGASDKPSDLYRAAQIHPPTPSVRLAKNLAIQPLEFALPKYPPLARMARIQGDVIFKFEIGQDGRTSNYTLVTGHPLLSPSVKDAVERWKFAPGNAEQQADGTIEFATNCSVKRQ